MYGFLKRPAWLALGLVVVLISGLFLRLGFWQLDRLEERRLENSVLGSRQSMSPAPLTSVVDPRLPPSQAGAMYERLRVTAEGEYRPEDEVLIRSQTHLGEAGYHVVTPLMIGADQAILVNRGWVPLGSEPPPIAATPPAGSVQLTLILQGTQTRGSVGPVDRADEQLEVFSRVDIERIAQQVEYQLLPVYGLRIDDTGGSPIPVELPELNEGTHLAYAIQWFAFALISIVGFAALVRTTAHRRGRGASPERAESISSEL